jgi:hypothetical protein
MFGAGPEALLAAATPTPRANVKSPTTRMMLKIFFILKASNTKVLLKSY